MCRLLLVVFALIIAVPALAADPPNTLSRKEISGGWLLLFDGETDWGWKQPGTVWTVKDGSLTAPSETGILRTTTEFGDFELSAEVAGQAGGKCGIGLTRPNGLVEVPLTGIAGPKWTTVTLRKEGGKLRYKAGGRNRTIALSKEDARTGVGLVGGGPGGAVWFRNLKLRPLALKSIFNGKDLTSWKGVPAHASVFTVTPEGWLNVKNGNGDLHSEGTYGDFVLQLDIFSNGDHLNSGIFFRANKGVFWSGYEAQIRNQWEGTDRTKPVDIGTGGIYNRQPARKVVSSDRQWFTMTVVAHGLHMATWVDGYQVADFTDTRPANEGNARAGARTAPGTVTIQGHDPTTDLSFRKIRIAEMPAAGG